MAFGNGSRASAPSVIIIGAGFGGLGLGIQLKRAGIDSFTILEKADAVGGVWRDNSYPGLTCDVPSHLYSFSFELKPDWSRRYPRRDEILAYLEHCTDKYGLRPHLRLGTEVVSADFDESEGRWRVRTATGDELLSEFLVSATGQLSRPADPNLPGIATFEGEMFHSARWNHDYDLTGKRVAAVGTGASAVQYIPEIQPRVEKLHVFQRTPGWTVPKPDRPYRSREKKLFRRFPFLLRLSRALVFLRFEILNLAFTGAVGWVTTPYELRHKLRVRRLFRDPELRKALVPDYPLGCKRALVTSEYLTALAEPNVEVIPRPVREVRPHSILGEDGTEREVDAIIFGTGFQTNDFLAPMAIRGLGGRDLNDAWRDGAEAYLGLAVSGFPNMFILYGPNTNLGSGSIIYMLEGQIGYVVEAVRALDRAGTRWMDVRPDVLSEFNREVQQRLDDTVWTAGCDSWYRTESGRVVNNWPGFMLEYRRRTRQPDLADFRLAPRAAPEPVAA